MARLPDGWKLAIGLCELVECDNSGDSDFERGMRTAAKRIRKELGAAAPQPPEGFMSEIRTTKPEAAPVQMPEPAGCVVYANGESHHWDANRECAELFASSERSRGAPYAFTFENLYTEQQVRQLLAAHGIQEQST